MEVVDNRIEIFFYIWEHPGAYYTQIRRELGLSSGTLSHHLHGLRRDRMIESHHDGYTTRYFSEDTKKKPPNLTMKQKEIVNVISNHRGITVQELSDLVGKTRQTVSHHVRNLKAKGFVRYRERKGKRHLYPVAVRKRR